MKMMFIALGLILLVEKIHGENLATDSKLLLPDEGSLTRPKLNVTVRAENCINNNTHCHCDLYPNVNNDRWCIKLKDGMTDRCMKVACSSGYHCDCASHRVCEKKTKTAYKMVAENHVHQHSLSQSVTTFSGEHHADFQCAPEEMTMPTKPISQTSDLKIQALGEYQVFINDNQIGFSTTSGSKIFTEELQSGDVLSICVGRSSVTNYGLKFQFNDLNGNLQTIDSTWYASATFSSDWLDPSFDASANGWLAPVSVANSDPGFDASVPWMWAAGDHEMIFFRKMLSW